MEWLDTARAACVIAVVTYHVYIWNFLVLDVPGWSFAGIVWEQISSLLGALRMPLLLVLSGTLAASKIRQGFIHGSAMRRSLQSYYIYLIWFGIYSAIGLTTSRLGVGVDIDIDGTYPALTQLLLPDTTLWFIYALALYVPLLALVRKAPPVIVLGILAVLNVAASLFPGDQEPFWVKIIRLAVFFAVGAYGKELIFRLADSRNWALAVTGVVAGVGLTAISFVQIPDAVNESLYLFRSLAFAGALIGLASITVHFRWVAAVGRCVGRRTLSVYLIHPILILLLALLTQGPLAPVVFAATRNSLLAAAYPLLIAAAIVSISVALEYVMRALRLDFLFQVPAWSRGQKEKSYFWCG